MIKSQPKLEIFGLYCFSGNEVLRPLKELHNSQLLFPIVLGLEPDGSYFSFKFTDHISIFPTFYSVDRRATIPQVLAQSFCKDQASTSYLIHKADSIITLSIYLVDSSDLPSVYGLAKEMAVIFTEIRYLNLWFEHRCDIVSFLLTIDDLTAPGLMCILVTRGD